MKKYVTAGLIVACVIFIALATIVYVNNINSTKNVATKTFTPVTKSLTIYTTIPPAIATTIANKYVATHHVKINFIPLTPAELQHKINSHDNFAKVDMIMTTSKQLTELSKANLLTNISSEQEDVVNAEFKDAHNHWIGVWYDPVVFCYNKDYVKNHWQIPTTWGDLALAPTIKIAMTDFLAASAASNIIFSLVEDRSLPTTLDILGKLQPKVVRYSKYLSTPVRMAGMGETDMAIAIQSEVLRYMDDNYPLSIIYPEDGTAYQLTAVGILKHSENRTEAAEFTNWLLGDEVQLALQRNKYYFVPTNYTSLAYRKFANKNIRLLKRNIILDEQAQESVLNKWVKEIRLKS